MRLSHQKLFSWGKARRTIESHFGSHEGFVAKFAAIRHLCTCPSVLYFGERHRDGTLIIGNPAVSPIPKREKPENWNAFIIIITRGTPDAFSNGMMTLSRLAADDEPRPAEPVETSSAPASNNPLCYSVTIFTQRWKEVRDFYVEILRANVLSERTDRYCEIELGGIPLTIRRCEYGEMLSYFHLYISMKNREEVLAELRRRGIIVTTVGPYTNFRDPEGRVIKLSEQKTIVS